MTKVIHKLYVSDVSDDALHISREDYKNAVVQLVLNTFGYNIDAPSESHMFTQLGISANFSFGKYINDYVMFSSLIHEQNRLSWTEKFHPRDWIVIINDEEPDDIDFELLDKKVNVSYMENLDNMYNNGIKKSSSKQFVGGNDNGLRTPVNGARQLHLKMHHNPKKDSAEYGYGYMYAAGHAHTLYQFFAINVLRQAMSQVHFINSKFYNQPKTLEDLLQKHLDIKIDY